jgi:hypothetical protein
MHWGLTLGLAALAGWVGVLLWREQERVEAERLMRFRQAADEQFRHLVVPSANPRLHFDGMQVTEVMDEETLRYMNKNLVGIELTRYSRNAAGEYFMFVHNPEGKPSAKARSSAMGKRPVPPTLTARSRARWVGMVAIVGMAEGLIAGTFCLATAAHGTGCTCLQNGAEA